MAALGILTLFALLIAAGVVLHAVRHTLLRWNDPKQEPRWTAGVTAVIAGTLIFALGVAYFIAMLFESDSPVLEARWEPSGSVRSPFRGGVSQLVSLNMLSVWLLLSGAAIGLGMSLKAKRFSLRNLLAAVCLVALIASIPHMLIQPRDPKAVISASVDRVMTAKEWATLERMLNKEQLYAAVSEEVKNGLPCPAAKAITLAELQPVNSPAHPMKVERPGPIGVQLTLRFANGLEQEQIESVFDQLNEYVRHAMPIQTSN